MHSIFWKNNTDEDLQKLIRSTVLPRISEQRWDDAGICPDYCLCHNVTLERILLLGLQFADGSERSDAVYVLECRHRSGEQERIAIEELRLQNPWWVRKAQQSERLFYVGVSKKVLYRLRQHVAGQGKGANFTQIFPPSRLITINWYENYSEARRAEELTEQVLSEELEDELVYQPG